MRNRYNQSFKDEAVALVLGGDESVSQIARDLGLNQQTLRNWMFPDISTGLSTSSSCANKALRLRNTKILIR